MRLTYVLLSPTFGMHQYTADLANRAAQGSGTRDQASGVRGQGSDGELGAAGHDVCLVTTTTLPRDRYSPAVTIHTPVTTHGTGFSREGLDIAAYRRVHAALVTHHASRITHHASLVHFTGVHAWNLPLVHALRRRGVPVIHTLHDLDPHHGVRFGPLIRLWNRLIIASGCHLLVHGRRYRDQLIAQGIPPARITCTPLLHGFLAADQPWPPAEAEAEVKAEVKVKVKAEAEDEDEDEDSGLGAPSSDQYAGASRNISLNLSLNLGLNLNLSLNVLFFGRVETYKGVGILLAAWEALTAELRANSCNSWQNAPRLVIAGPVARGVALPPLPAGVELRDRRIGDEEAVALFRAAELCVLPYLDASQSALVAAAYAFGVPVIVTDAGALPEYVIAGRAHPGRTGPGETGWVVPAGDAAALAAVLREALADPARLHRMGAAGRAWFAARREEEQAALAGMYFSLACRSGILLR